MQWTLGIQVIIRNQVLVRKSLESEIDEAQAADIYYRFSLSMFLQGRALCAAIPSGKTEDSWLVGCRILKAVFPLSKY